MFFCCMSVIGMAALFSSCTDDNGTPDEPDVDFVGSSIKVPNEVGTYSVQMEFDHNWEVSNKTTWFSITPLSGTPGTATISVTVVDTNPDLIERVASFIIKNTDAGTNTQYYVIQDATLGFNLAGKIVSISAEAQSYVLSLQGNTDFEATVADGADWITVDSVTETDSTLLNDDTTYSAYRTYNINMQVDANDGEVRSTEVYLSSIDGAVKDTIEVSQFGEISDAEWNREFYKRSYLAKFSATWCGPCYTASNYIHQAMEQIPDRIELGQYMSSSQGGGISEWSGGNSYYSYYISKGYFEGYIPAFDWNHYLAFESAQGASTWVQLSNEAVAIPAQTAIAGMASIVNGNVEVNLSIASKVAADYNVSVFLLEDSLYTNCAGGSDYPNNDIIRAEFTDTFGSVVTIAEKTVEDLNYSIAVPDYVVDQNNLHVLCVVYKEGSYSSSVLPSYECDFGTIVDNAVDIPVNGFVTFKYEE